MAPTTAADDVTRVFVLPALSGPRWLRRASSRRPARLVRGSRSVVLVATLLFTLVSNVAFGVVVLARRAQAAVPVAHARWESRSARAPSHNSPPAAPVISSPAPPAPLVLPVVSVEALPSRPAHRPWKPVHARTRTLRPAQPLAVRATLEDALR